MLRKALSVVTRSVGLRIRAPKLAANSTRKFWPSADPTAPQSKVRIFAPRINRFALFSRSVGNDVRSVKSGRRTDLFYTREISWPPGGKLLFRLPLAGVSRELDRTDVWKLRNPALKFYEAPFFNRKDVLLQMLRVNYDMFRSVKSTKPTYAIQAMGTGSGKTRLLREWVFQAFSKYDDVIVPFLEKNGNSQPAKMFLNLLYYSAYRQYFILCDGIQVNLPDDLVAQKLVCEAIFSRHAGTTTVFEDKELVVDEESCNNLFGFGRDLKKLLLLYIQLADSKFEAPSTYPFPDSLFDTTTDSGFIFFLIDECQQYSQKNPTADPDILYQLFTKAASYHPVCRKVGIYPFWYATGTYIPGKVIPLRQQTSHFDLVSASLDCLLEIKYLARICIQFLGHQLHESFFKPDDKSDCPQMSEELSTILVRNFMKTFGNPRAIEEFVGAIVEFVLPQMEAMTKPNQSLAIQLSAALELRKLDMMVADKVRMKMGLNNIGRIIAERKIEYEEVELLNIRAALCHSLPASTKLAGFNETPSQLVASNILTVWHRTEETTYYTRPFFTFETEDLLAKLDIMEPKIPPGDGYSLVFPTLASLVLEEAVGGLLQANDLKGDVLEKAVACSIYANYVVAAKTGEVKVRDLFPSAHRASWMKTVLRSDTSSAKVELSGVVKLTSKIDSESLRKLIKLKAVGICNSKFADVLVPITITTSNGQTTKILALQCKLHKKQLSSKHYRTNAKACLAIPEVAAWLGVAPVHMKSALKQPQLLTGEQAVLIPADDVVSPLFLVGASFLPTNKKDTPKKMKTTLRMNKQKKAPVQLN